MACNLRKSDPIKLHKCHLINWATVIWYTFVCSKLVQMKYAYLSKISVTKIYKLLNLIFGKYGNCMYIYLVKQSNKFNQLYLQHLKQHTNTVIRESFFIFLKRACGIFLSLSLHVSNKMVRKYRLLNTCYLYVRKNTLHLAVKFSN